MPNSIFDRLLAFCQPSQISEQLRAEPEELPEILLKNPSPILLEERLVNFQIPPISVLEPSLPGISARTLQLDIEQKRVTLEQRLEAFGAKSKVIRVSQGPIITNFEIEPALDVKINRITSLANDLALALRVDSIRIVSSLGSRGTIGIEIPNKFRETVALKDVINTKDFQESRYRLPLAFGKSTSGQPVIHDLTQMPHLLVAGETGAGKSVFIHSLILSLLLKHPPDTLRLLLIDPKQVELSAYRNIPHLVDKIIFTPESAVRSLERVVRHMKERYRLLKNAGAQNIEGYNSNPENIKLPYLVVIVDELADLMMVAKKPMEANIARIAQMARAVGIHLILATQRPSVNIVTGVIKANFPARIAFRVTSGIDSRVILDTQGAEKLLGKGDMLFLSPTQSNPERIHGPFTRQIESLQVVNFLLKQGIEQPFNWMPIPFGEFADPNDNDEESANEKEERPEDSDMITIETHQKVTYNSQRMR